MKYHKTTIFNQLKETDPELAKIFEESYDIAEPLLARTVVFFPDFTSHTLDHSDNVIKNLDSVIPAAIIKEMASKHLFILLMASLFHDIGMASTDVSNLDELEIALSNERQLTIDEINLIRENHHNRSCGWIQKSKHLKPIDDIKDKEKKRKLREMISLVARAHRKIQLPDPEIDSMSRDYDVHSLNFLAAALRLADEMDITSKRIAWISERLDVILKMTGDQRKAFLTHSLVKDWHLSRRAEILVLYAQVGELTTINQTIMNTTEILDLLNSLTKKVKKTLQETSIVPWKGVEFLLPTDLRLETSVNHPIYGTSTKSNILTRADVPAVVDYITMSLFKDVFLVLRELVSNGLDACMPIEPSKDYKPMIDVNVANIQVENKSIVNLTISDNGIGMNKGVLENHFFVLGASYVKSPDYHRNLNFRGIKSRDHAVIGNYGIGVFSALSISNMIEVQTVPIEKPTQRYIGYLNQQLCPIFEISNNPKLLPHGTIITIPLAISTDEQLIKLVTDYIKRVFIRPRSSILVHGKVVVDAVSSTIGITSSESEMHDGVDYTVTYQEGGIYAQFNFTINSASSLRAWTSFEPGENSRFGDELLINPMRVKQRRFQRGSIQKASTPPSISSYYDRWRDTTRVDGFGLLVERTEEMFLREGILFDSVIFNSDLVYDIWPFQGMIPFFSGACIDFGSDIVDIDLSRQKMYIDTEYQVTLFQMFTSACCDLCLHLLKNTPDVIAGFVDEVLAPILVLSQINLKPNDLRGLRKLEKSILFGHFESEMRRRQPGKLTDSLIELFDLCVVSLTKGGITDWI